MKLALNQASPLDAQARPPRGLRVGASDRRTFGRTGETLNNVEVKPSVIEGLGVLALCSFRKGERIRRIRHDREITPEAPLRDDECVEHCSYPAGRIILVAFPDRHVNHSCDPNAYKLYEGDEEFKSQVSTLSLLTPPISLGL